MCQGAVRTEQCLSGRRCTSTSAAGCTSTSQVAGCTRILVAACTKYIRRGCMCQGSCLNGGQIRCVPAASGSRCPGNLSHDSSCCLQQGHGGFGNRSNRCTGTCITFWATCAHHARWHAAEVMSTEVMTTEVGYIHGITRARYHLSTCITFWWSCARCMGTVAVYRGALHERWQSTVVCVHCRPEIASTFPCKYELSSAHGNVPRY